MKTNITTLITICALGIIGLNANAANYRNSISTERISKAGNSGSAQFLLNEDADAVVDFQKEAQLLTKWAADREEAKAVQKLFDEGFSAATENVSVTAYTESTQPVLNENAETTGDFHQEAQMLTKWVADKEEAKAVQKLIEEGKLAENE